MLIRRICAISLTALTLAALLPQPSYAWEHHHYPHFGVRMSFLPHGSLTVGVSGRRYYYYDGVYYDYVGRDYVVVQPPPGVIVNTIPTYYQPVIVNGVNYYVNDGVYYVYTPYGYQVVPAPVVAPPPAPVMPVVVQSAQQPAAVAPDTAAAPADQDVFTVNVPNDKGGYTAVTIKKSGNGFTGPQGEFYDQFPKIAQLKVMYGK